MIPIGEDADSNRRTPYVTVALILAMFGVALALGGPEREALGREITSTFGMSPSRLLADPLAGAPTLVTYVFLHGGFLHLATNLLFLWVFGKGLEHELGWWYLPFFLVCGAAAGLTSAIIRAGSDTPTIGASGAISGVLGAYLVLLPHASIRAIILIPWFFLAAVLRGERPIWDVPAWTAIITWFVLQVVESIGPNAIRSGVDYAAHIGGFLVGYGLIRLLRHVFGLWPDEPTYQRMLDRPAAQGAPLPSSYVRAARMISAGAPIVRDDIEWVSRGSGYVDPDAVPGRDGTSLVGRRLRSPRYRYEPIRWEDLEPAE